jgi:spermidine synthase
LTLGGLLMGLSNQAWLAHLPGTLVAIGLWGLVCWLFGFKRFRLVLGSVLMILLSQFSVSSLGGVLTTQRSFFGVYQVLRDPAGEYQTLLHGTTVHGQQSLDPNRQRQPLTYFTQGGPIGQVFTSLQAQHQPQRVAVLGLGVGTLAAYAQPGQDWTFYEIDPLVTQLALDQRYFTFLSQTPVQPKLVSGDAREQIQMAAAGAYDLIVMDAFSSDAIPVHLVTQEALQLYLEKLSDSGLIVVNITNRHLDLSPVLARLAQELDLVGVSQFDRDVSDAEKATGKAASRWVVLARQPQQLAALSQDERWQPLVAKADAPLWTDDFSNLWQIWRRE